jgi:hypothetical protein
MCISFGLFFFIIISIFYIFTRIGIFFSTRIVISIIPSKTVCLPLDVVTIFLFLLLFFAFRSRTRRRTADGGMFAAVGGAFDG